MSFFNQIVVCIGGKPYSKLQNKYYYIFTHCHQTCFEFLRTCVLYSIQNERIKLDNPVHEMYIAGVLAESPEGKGLSWSVTVFVII